MSQAFRVKVDLSKVFNDARRFSWIFIDQSTLLNFMQVKQYITQTFFLKEPFHLLLNGTEYLPINESTRILKENEVLTVMPGSGWWNSSETRVMPLTMPVIQNASLEEAGTSNSKFNKETQTIIPRVDKSTECSSVTCNTTNSISTVDATTADMTATDITMFHSILNDTEMDDSVSESKATDSNITEDYSITESTPPITKRKRIRKRKSKKQTPSMPLTHDTSVEETDPKKPKIINSFIISRGKHIRFDGTNDQCTPSKDSKPNKSVTRKVPQAGSHQSILSSMNRTLSSVKDLSTLLALRQSSTPLTFACRKMQQEMKTENLFDESTRSDNSVKKTNGSTITSENVTRDKCCSIVNFEQYPIMKVMAQANDVIAFKVLKMGSDSSPQISDFVMGKVIDYHPLTLQYTFEMIKGKDEIQSPNGKFALPQDDDTELVETDTITLYHSELIEPRLIFSK